MDRRKFLKILAGSVPAIVAPTYFLPPRGGWSMTPSGIAVPDPFVFSSRTFKIVMLQKDPDALGPDEVITGERQVWMFPGKANISSLRAKVNGSPGGRIEFLPGETVSKR